MALTMGTGPFGPEPAGRFNFTRQGPEHVLYWEPVPKRVRVRFAGETLADSERTMLLHETGLLPVYYFPLADVRPDLLQPTEHSTRCPFKGDASYWTVRSEERVAENAAWGYPEPLESAPPIAGYVAFYWQRMDAWLEEDEEVFAHPRDPYHRIDILDSSRHVRVSVKGRLLAETRRPKLLVETGLPRRLYVPMADVDDDLLVASDTQTRCPYKGLASYWSVDVDGTSVDDAAWFYPQPSSAAARIADHVCFFDDKVDVDVA